MSNAAPPPPGFDRDIFPLFTPLDIAGMAGLIDLTSYADVRAHAADIHDRLRAIGGRVMPPPPPRGDGPWPANQIALFKAWIDGGFHP